MQLFFSQVCVRAGTRWPCALSIYRLAHTRTMRGITIKTDLVSRVVHRRHHPWHAPLSQWNTAICTLSHRKIKVDGQHYRHAVAHLALTSPLASHLVSSHATTARYIDRYFTTSSPTSSHMYSHAYDRVHISV